MVLRELMFRAAARSIGTIVGVYRPTDRNKLVEQHYANLGFTLAGQSPDGSTTWRLEVAGVPPEAAPMTVRYIGMPALDSAALTEP
jgi:predicted enzyme involved in methoxymalonyl-ACP biosynthesis